MEWLMEELEAPPSSSSSHRSRSNHSNGHIRTKRVNTDGLRSFSLDEQEDDSEDEVLSVPGVRVVKPSSASSRKSTTHHTAFLQVSVLSPINGSLLTSQKKLTWGLNFRRRATRTWSAFWTSRIGRGRAEELVLQASVTVTPPGNGRRRTATRTSSGCDVSSPFLFHSVQSELFSQ